MEALPKPQTNNKDFIDQSKEAANQDPNQKRHRRSKNDANGRDFKCPECGKCYLSSPALTNHRKTKHDYGKDGEKKGRGRPRKEPLPHNQKDIEEQKYLTFFEKDLRKSQEKEPVSLALLKTNLSDIFRMCKKEIFEGVETLEAYPLYIILVNNWDLPTPDYGDEGVTSVLNQQVETGIAKSYTLDALFFIYLKEASYKSNYDYFWFMLKFIVLLRECVNIQRRELIKEAHVTEVKKEYSQIYNGETMPDICNEFFENFMEPNNFFGLDFNELIEAVQHFCMWLYNNNHTKSQLTLLNKV